MIIRINKGILKAILISIILTFIILEVGLRLTAFGFLAWQSYDNRITDKTSDVYRILTVGESTTANLHNGQGTWPDELEIILNNGRPDIRFEVFNEGVPGKDTFYLLSKLEGNLDKYNPDMVIVMMGINDHGLYVERQENEGNVMGFFKDLRVYKLTKLVFASSINKITGKKPTDIDYETEEKLYDGKEREYNAEKDYNATEKRLREAVKMNPDDDAALNELQEFYIKHEDFEKLSPFMWEMIELRPRTYEELVKAADSFNLVELYGDEEKVLKQILELDPNSTFAYLRLGITYLKRGIYEDAIPMFEEVIQIEPGDLRGYQFLGSAYKNLNRTEEAIEQFEIATSLGVQKGKFYQDVSTWLAEEYVKVNRSTEANYIFEQLIELTNDNWYAYSQSAFYYLDQGDMEKAEEIFNEVYRINPRGLQIVYYEIGNRYEEQGIFEEANKMYKKSTAIKLGHFNPDTQENYQKLYEMVNGRDITIIAMQYPTLDLEEVKDMLDETEGIIFVENTQNFENALSNATFEDFFVDRIRGLSFGHTTIRGNILIAENVANVILKDPRINLK